MFFDSLVAWAEICVEHVRLQTLLWWLGRRGADQLMDGEDLIICLALWTLYKRRPPLRPDDFRASSIAPRNKLRLASLFGAILVVLGGQNRCPNSILESFFSMSFSKAFWHRNFVDFWKLETRKITIFPKENNDFHKISFFDKDPKNIEFSLHFERPERRKFQ